LCRLPVADQDRKRFVQMVLDELENLYEGNALRFGLRPLEVAAWRGKGTGGICRELCLVS
jgi:hypothetical protein